MDQADEADTDTSPPWTERSGVDTADPWSASDVDVRGAMRACRHTGAPAAVATIAAVEGSAYRRPGAKMVIDEGGHYIGGITAGCLEEPVVDLAGSVIETGEPAVETFDLTDDGEWDFGLGCNGVITVLVEPLDDSWDPVLSALDGGSRVAVAIALDATNHAFAEEAGAVERGARWVLVAGDGSNESRPADPHWTDRRPLPGDVHEAVSGALETALERGESDVVPVQHEGAQIRVLVDGQTPPERLVVFGAQPDVRPLSRLARQVGFHVTVASPRGARADSADFPAAHEVEAVRPDEIGRLVDERASVVCMSHSFVEDRMALETLLATPAPYVGMMGPKSRFEELREALAADGVEIDESALSRIAAPVGLDVGADAPPEIALSIVAEILAVANDRDGGRLRDSARSIHTRAGLGD